MAGIQFDAAVETVCRHAWYTRHRGRGWNVQVVIRLLLVFAILTPGVFGPPLGQSAFACDPPPPDNTPPGPGPDNDDDNDDHDEDCTGAECFPTCDPNDSCDDCGNPPNPEGTLGSSGTGLPINLLRGSVLEEETDLVFAGSVMKWSLTRSYDSSRLASDSGTTEVATTLGYRWMTGAMGPYIVQEGSDIAVLFSGTTKQVFTYSSGSFTPPIDYNATLVKTSGADARDYDHDGNSSETVSYYTLTETDTGRVLIFGGFDAAALAEEARGRLVELTNRAFQGMSPAPLGNTYTYNNTGGAAGSLSSVLSAVPVSDGIYFTYYDTGVEAGRLKTVSVSYNSVTTQKVEYTYYGNVTANTDLGSAGDLIQVKVTALTSTGTDITNAAHTNVRYTQYRYYPLSGNSDGKKHQLKMVIESDAIQRIIDDNSNVSTAHDILALTDTSTTGSTLTKGVKDFASRAFTYYTSDFTTNASQTTAFGSENLATKYGTWSTEYYEFNSTTQIGVAKSETINGSCASCSGGGSGSGIQRTYYYMNLNEGLTSLNAVKRLIVEDTKDATPAAAYRQIFGVNSRGARLRQAKIENPTASPVKVWCNSKILTSTARIERTTTPSAHTDVDSDSEIAQFMDPYYYAGSDDWSYDTATVSASAGVVYYFGYNGDGYPTDKWIRQGADTSNRGTPGQMGGPNNLYYLSAVDWGSGSSNQPKSVMVASYEYPTMTTSRTDSTRITTSFTYTYWNGNESAMKTKTTTLPTITDGTGGSVNQNGSGTATTVSEYYDLAGRLRWTKDGEGFVNYYSYHPELRGQAYMMVDVNTSSVHSDITNGSSGKWIASTVDDADDNMPSGGSGASALQIVTKQEFDSKGRATLAIDAGGAKHYTIYETNRTIRLPYWDSTNTKSLLPTQVTVVNDCGVTTETYSIKGDSTSITDASGVPTGISGTPARADMVSWTRYFYDPLRGQPSKTLQYHTIPSSGDEDSHFNTYYHVTAIAYDALGRPATTVQTVSTDRDQITQRTYDDLGRVTEVKRDAGDSNVDTGRNGSVGTLSLGGLVTVSTTTYDSGGVGNSHVTKSREYHTDSSNGSLYSELTYHRTYRGHLRGVQRNYNGSATPETPHSVLDIDWMGRTAASALYTGSTFPTLTDYTAYIASNSTGRNNWSKTYYDQLGRVYKTESFPGAEATKHFETNNYYNRNGQLVGTGQRYATHMEYAYDGAGRQYQSRTVFDLASTKYSSGVFNYVEPAPDPDITSMESENDGGVIVFMHTNFDADGQPTAQHDFELNHQDQNGINMPSTSSFVRRSVFMWYDDADRLKTTADYGSGDGDSSPSAWAYSAITSSPSEPTWTSAAVYDGYVNLTTYGYNAASGRPETVTIGVKKNGSNTDKMATKTIYDALGRRLAVAENFVDYSYTSYSSSDSGVGGGTNNEQDRVTKFEYNGLGQTTKLKAVNAGTDNQETEYLHTDSYNASLVTLTKYPDGNTNTSGTQDNVQVSYNLDGSVATQKDQRGVVHTITYDTARRIVRDGATTIPGGVDDHVKSIARTYDDMGRVLTVTSYSNNDGTGTVRNQIKYNYDATLGLLTSVDQDHTDAVGTGTAHQTVSYGYDTSDTSNIYDDGLRPQKITYPDGRIIWHTFGSYSGSVADRLNRITLIEEDSSGSPGTDLVEYSYSGSGRLAVVDYQAPDFKLDLFQGTSGTYAGYDRFGRTVDQFWDGYNSTSDVSRVKHGYDYAGNRTWREDTLAKAQGTPKYHDEFYTYDTLQRLTNMKRGQLTGGPPPTGISGTPGVEQGWTLDQLGNWPAYIEKAAGTTTLDQTRAHNVANETGVIGASTGTNWTDPTHDLAGNMTALPASVNPAASYDLTYDAWNRLVKVMASTTLLAGYEYDGLGQVIIKDAWNDSFKREYFYNNQWQVIEERGYLSGAFDADPRAQYVWHPYYVDAFAVRYYDSDMDNNLAELTDGTHYYAHDANFNVTAVVNASGTALERYQYSPYGLPKILDADFAADSDNVSDIDNTHLYTGREYDWISGLQLNRNRFYAPHLGRWVNRDPIGYEGETRNLYEYVGASPTASRDPSGLAPTCAPMWSFVTGGPTLVTAYAMPNVQPTLVTNPVPASMNFTSNVACKWTRKLTTMCKCTCGYFFPMSFTTSVEESQTGMVLNVTMPPGQPIQVMTASASPWPVGPGLEITLFGIAVPTDFAFAMAACKTAGPPGSWSTPDGCALVK